MCDMFSLSLSHNQAQVKNTSQNPCIQTFLNCSEISILHTQAVLVKYKAGTYYIIHIKLK